MLKFIKLTLISIITLSFTSLAQSQEIEDLLQMSETDFYVKGSEVRESPDIVGWWMLLNIEEELSGKKFKSKKVYFLANCRTKRFTIDSLYYCSKEMGKNCISLDGPNIVKRWSAMSPDKSNMVRVFADVLCKRLPK
jgi:hypothetical protein